jgi:Tol biopolymer transport system component
MTRPVLLTLVVLAMLGIRSAHAATVPADSTALLSGGASLFDPLPAPVSDSTAGLQSVSTDGRFVAFSSKSDGLSGEDNDAVENVYVKDRLTGTVTFASRRSGASGAPSDRDCFHPSISDNGHRVAFACTGALDPEDSNPNSDIYVRDLTTDQTILASRASGAHGAVSDSSSDTPVLDADGSRVAFTSRAENIADIAPSRSDNVFLRDLDTNQTLFLSRAGGLAGAAGNGPALFPSISNDGDVVSFESSSSNLVAGDTNGKADIFVRRVSTGDNTLVSRKDGATGTLGNDASFNSAISGDGSVVAFDSDASNLLAADLPDHTIHVYRRSLSQATNSLVDQVGGTRSDRGAAFPSINDDGSVISFDSTSTNLDPPASAAGFYVSVNGGPPTLVSRESGSSGAPLPEGNRPAGVSGDGSKVVFGVLAVLGGDGASGVSNIALRDRTTNTTELVSRPPSGVPFSNQGGFSTTPSLSADGRYAAFATDAPGLLPPGVQFGVVVRDTATGATVLASREDGPAGAPLQGGSFTVSISANGRRVAFDELTATGARVWVRDLVTGSTMLANRENGPSGQEADGFSAFPSIDGDGGRVEFLSSATDLSDADPNTDIDSYVRDLDTGQTFLASRADGPDGTSADADVDAASLSADGRHVAFATTAKNLGDGDTDDIEDVHVRDLDAGTTRLASVNGDGAKGESDSEGPSIDAHGQRVAFSTGSNNLTGGGPTQVFVHDMTTGTTVLASRADGADGEPANARSDFPLISADGRIVAFLTDADNLVAGVEIPDVEVFRRDLTAGTTRLVSRAQGPAGAPARDPGANLGGITADGACVGFTADDSLVNPGPGVFDFDQAYMRAFTTDCGRPPMVTAPRDTTAPVLRAVSLSRTRFRVAKGSTKVSAAAKKKKVGRGTTLRFTSSEAAKLTIRIERVLPGRKSGKGRKRVCKPVRHKVRRGRCTAFRRTATLTRTIKAGPGRVALTGRIGRRRMAAGRYRLTLTARDAAGNTSKATRRNFSIVPG